MSFSRRVLLHKLFSARSLSVSVPVLEQASASTRGVELSSAHQTHPLLLLQKCLSLCYRGKSVFTSGTRKFHQPVEISG